MLIHPKYLSAVANMDVKSNMRTIAIAGGAVGLGKTLTDDIDDDAITAATNTAAAAGIAVGGAYSVRSAAAFVKGGKDNRILQREMDRQSAGDVAGEANRKSTFTTGDTVDADMKRRMGQFNKVNRIGRFGLAAGALAFGAATVLDINSRVEDSRRADDMVAQQEQGLRDRNRQETQMKQEQGYGNINLGEMAFQMFNERIGHHKMGNAKFQ